MLPSGWADNVLIVVGDDGMIASVATNMSDVAAERLNGPVVPGMPNLHSYAFQRRWRGLRKGPVPKETASGRGES
jgi:formimidoylglutamate deiminase